MDVKRYFKVSLSLNILYTVLFILIAFKFKEKIISVFVNMKGKAEIVMFGDSITQHGEWNSLLHRHDIRNSGIGGFTTSHLIGTIRTNVFSYQPKICFVMCGINDIYDEVPVQKIEQNYAAVVKAISEQKIIPVVQSTLYCTNNPEINKKVDSLNTFLINYCQSNRVVFLDINSLLSTKDGLKKEYALDELHLNQAAYPIWVKELEKYLNYRNAKK